MMTMARIAEEVATRHRISVEELKSKSLQRRLAWPRQEAWWRMRLETRASYPAIARLFGRDHTTVIYGVRAFERRCSFKSDDDPLGFWPCLATAP